MEESDLTNASSAKTGTGKTKAKRPRATTTRSRTPKTKAAKAAAEASAATEPTLFTEAPKPAFEPAPVRTEPAPEPAPAREEAAAPAPERPVFVPSSESAATSSEPASHQPLSDHPGEAPAENASGGSAPSGGGFSQAPQSEEERGPWWKRKKDRKKNKWMEKQQGGRGEHPGHQQHPPRQAHPQQPPPPVFVQHYGDLPDPARFADSVALDALAAELLAGSGGEPIQLDQIYALNVGEVTAYARKLGVVLNASVPNRLQTLEAIFKHATEAKIPVLDHGWVDLTDKGHGFVVHGQANYRLYPENSYIPETLIKRYGLKRGHHIDVVLQAPQGNDRCPAVVGIRSAMGKAPEEIANVTPFEELVPYYPLQRILLEAPEIHKDISMRAVDLLTPIGFGQRGLLVAPPRTGKTVLLQNIANSISHNFPEKKLILLLIDERPEEVTDFRRHTHGEVVSSTFDEAPESHVHAAEMVIEKARRLVELGEHVIILLDSITRLARAYNALASNSGKIMSGGVEATALQKPKRFFGSARNIEGGGSITIIGTALIDTGSRMDEVIFEEFKGTGNMELHLDRGLSDKRIFPAINIDRSGTRKEELIYHPEEMQRVYGLRRAMQGIPPVEAMDMLIQRLKKTKTNAEFLMSLNR
ncbi:MAG: transcription termination factor Rho [Verrucomicrobia bacterium]|nr:transcription termination factor Rho [Verrucomicrobiota bacterium]